MKLYKGIDISLWQKNPDFSKLVKQGIDFVMIKASEGASVSYPYPFKDPYFDKNVINLANTKSKIYGGSYHLLTGQTENAVKNEADFYIQTIKPYKYNLQLWAVLDVEIPSDKVTMNRATFSRLVKLFTDKVKEAGFRPMIYTAQWYINAFFDVPADVPLWLIDVNTNKFPANATMWQAGISQLDGVSGNVDIDYAYNIMGDVNNDGKVNNKDVIAMMKHIVNPKKNPINESQGDFDRDGKITAKDVTALMRTLST